MADSSFFGAKHDSVPCQIVAAGYRRREWVGKSTLTYSHTINKVCHMRTKTTINIDDTVMVRLKREAARQGRTMSEMIETAVRRLLSEQRQRAGLAPLPSFNSGGQLVDISDRDALYQAMEGR